MSHEFNIDNETIIDPANIANKFNEYFANIGNSLSQQIQATNHFGEYLRTPPNTSFNFESISVNNISIIINKLKNKSSCGHDLISNKLIKYC